MGTCGHPNHGAHDHNCAPFRPMPEPQDIAALRETARGRLAALNVDGWRQESGHGCDGTEEGCAASCPVPIQVQVSPDEIIDAILDAFEYDAERERGRPLQAAVEALAEEWEGTVYKLPPGYRMTVNEYCRYWFKTPLSALLAAHVPSPLAEVQDDRERRGAL